jgi:hypothetical protein
LTIFARLRIVLRILSLGSAVIVQQRHVSCLAVKNTDPNPYPDKTARHESISRLRSSAFVQNEYFGKIRRELRTELRT